MLYINIAFIFIFGVLYTLSVKRTGALRNTVDKKEHRLYFLYPMADLLLDKTGLYRLLKRKDQTSASVKALNVTGNPDAIQKIYWCSKSALVLFVLIIFDILSILGQLKAQSTSEIVGGTYLIRPEAGEGNRPVELNVTMDRISTENPESVSQQSEDVTIDVGERKYTPDELTVLFEKAKEYLDKSLLGDNQKEDLIYNDLFFCETIPGTGISVKWQPEDTRLVGWDGTVHNENIEPGGADTVISAVLSCQDIKIDYEKKLKIMPRRYNEKEQLDNQLKKEIDISLNSDREDKRLLLPQEAGGYRLSWRDKEQHIGIKIFLLGILSAACIWFYKDRELARKMKIRKEQMLLDYPEIINKFTLLVNAGMTVRQAWCRITKDYEMKQEAKREKKRYAYEEMQVTVHELNLGIPEADAYEQFGRRAGLIPYMKFGSLIAQNLKKGNKGISELLTKEAVDAFEERKETAKRLGEEAGTKLLMPMMIMLIIVFAVILVPAFLSFRL